METAKKSKLRKWLGTIKTSTENRILSWEMGIKYYLVIKFSIASTTIDNKTRIPHMIAAKLRRHMTRFIIRFGNEIDGRHCQFAACVYLRIPWISPKPFPNESKTMIGRLIVLVAFQYNVMAINASRNEFAVLVFARVGIAADMD